MALIRLLSCDLRRQRHGRYHYNPWLRSVTWHRPGPLGGHGAEEDGEKDLDECGSARPEGIWSRGRCLDRKLRDGSKKGSLKSNLGLYFLPCCTKTLLFCCPLYQFSSPWWGSALEIASFPRLWLKEGAKGKGNFCPRTENCWSSVKVTVLLESRQLLRDVLGNDFTKEIFLLHQLHNIAKVNCIRGCSFSKKKRGHNKSQEMLPLKNGQC